MFLRCIAVMLLTLFVVGCTERTGPVSDAGGRVGVMVSIEPMAAFVEAVGGERVHVTVMVPKGASPHTYEPKPSQLRSVGLADLYVKVGSGVEFERTWMERLVELSPGMAVADSSKGIKLLDVSGIAEKSNAEDKAEVEKHADHADHAGGVDPHIWTSPKNAMQMVENIYAALVAVDPDGKALYSENRDGYIKKLKALDRRILSLLKDKRGRRVITYHPAWAYLSAEYGLIEVPVEYEGKAPTPQGVARIIKRARAEQSRFVFASPQFSARAAEVIAKEIGATVVSISPLERDYIENMDRVAAAFSRL